MNWQPISTAPHDRPVRVGHELDPYSMKADSIVKIYGFWNDADQCWDCNSGFTCTDNTLDFQPTHWLPENGDGQ